MQLPLFDLPSDWVATPVSELPSWRGVKRLSIDCETNDPHLHTTGPSVRTGGYVVGVSFAVEDGPSHYLPVRHYLGGNLPAAEVWSYLRGEAAAFDGILVGANLNYDLDFLAEAGVVFPNIKQQRDVLIADPLIYELHNSYSLEAVALRHGLPGKDEDHLRKAAMHYGCDPKKDLWKLPAKHVGVYATADAVRPLQVLRRQETIIEDQNLWKVFRMECLLQPILLKMKRHGVLIDQSKLGEIARWSLLQEELQLKEIARLTGRRLKVGDVNKKGPLVPLLQSIGVVLGETPSGQPQIDKDALDHMDHPVAQCISRARKVNKLRTTFVASIERHMVNGRIHATFNQIFGEREQGDLRGARYGRMSSTDPNMQQQPARDDFAAMWRSIYIPDRKDQIWVSADYSQQEPRMLTHYAEKRNLPRAHEAAEAYRLDPRADNHDMMTLLIHPEMAGLDRKSATFQKARKHAKNIFLGLCYGMGSAKLARSIGLPTKWIELRNGRQMEVAGDEAQRVLDKFNAKVPYVPLMAKKCSEKAELCGYITTIGGRRCRFPRKADGKFDWTHKALNRLIQGSSGDQTKMAVIALYDAALTPQLQVHDEVCGGYDSMEQARAVKEIMETCLPLSIPSRVDLEVGPSWGEAA